MMPVAPLQPWTVLDLSGSVAGRYCGRLFAKLGARVHRGAGEGCDLGIGSGGAAGEGFGRWLDEGKLGAEPTGPVDLVISHDALSDELAGRYGGAARLEMRWFDDDGPYARWSANDPVIQALAGMVHGFGPAEGPPLIAQGCAPQIVAGVTGFIAALAILVGRARGSRARTAAVSIFEAACCFSEPNSVSYAHHGEHGKRLGINRFIPTYPCSIYPARDGWIGVTALTPAQWDALAALIGRPELGEEPRFATTLDRLAHADEIDTLLMPALAARDAADLAEAGQEARIPMVPVPDLSDLPYVAHWRGRGAFEETLAGLGSTPGLPFRFAWQGEARQLPAIAASDLPLTGLRVADFTMGWAGPLATRLLADLGADVIKIEAPDHPDWWRGWEKPEPGATIEETAVFSVVNRGKRGVVIDLKTSDGRAAADDLIADADVVIENFAPGVMERLGYSTERLRALQPALVLIAMGAFGQHGPWRGFRAYGSTVEQASGLPTFNGFDDGPPALQHIAYGDPVAGLYGAAAALIGLAARGRLGGCMVDLAQVETLFQIGADAIIARQLHGAPLPRAGSRRNAIAPCCVAPAAGGDRWLAIACHDRSSWHALCDALGRRDWREDPALTTPEGRNAAADTIEAGIAEWSAERRLDDAVSILQAAGAPAAPVRPVETLVADPQLVAAGYWAEIDRAHIGRYASGAAPFRIDGVRPCATRPAPTFGEHQAEVMHQLANRS